VVVFGKFSIKSGGFMLLTPAEQRGRGQGRRASGEFAQTRIPMRETNLSLEMEKKPFDITAIFQLF
jgi:hypothetical protein